MQQISKNDIEFHITEPNLHNQNPVEGTIREIGKKWYQIMVRKRVPIKLWDYGMRWVTDIMSLTYTSTRDIEAGDWLGCIPFSRFTEETADISEYLDFGFYDQVWYKDNAGLGPQHPGRWIGVASKQGNLMCYHILKQNGKVLVRSSVQRVTQLELQTTEYKGMFEDFYRSIKDKLNFKD